MSTLAIEEQHKLWLTLPAMDAGMYRQAVANGTISLPDVQAYDATLKFKTACPATTKLKASALRLASRKEPVLITGESGCGKELLARILHGVRQGQFIAVNTCAITDTLFESELFGHTKGSFTGADKEKDGLIKQTEGERGEQGTLFLDEIGDMPLHLQPKLLRVIQELEYRKVGGDKMLPVKCRFVAATHQNLRKLVSEGKFRLDLYERINTFKLHIPPLRERLEELELFVTADTKAKLLKQFTAEKLHFSGNVRQLLNLKLRAEVLGWDSLTEEDVA